MSNKMCTACKIGKNETIDFYYIKRTNKFTTRCKQCIRLYAKNYRQKRGLIKGVYGKSKYDYLVGKKIYKWTVLKRIKNSEGWIYGKASRSNFWCRCDCGIEKSISALRLVGGTTKGCITCIGRDGSKSPLFKGVGEISITYLKKLRAGAEARGLEFNTTPEEIWELYLKQNKLCALTGLSIDFGKHTERGGIKDQTRTASLDRIDSKRGYDNDNIQWVHKHINVMKNRFDEAYFIKMCNLVIENANRNSNK